MKIQGLRLLPLFVIISLLFVFPLFLPRYLLAKSGCCSGHSGVNCSAGAQANGNVICNDGWRGSSCSYSGMVMCGGTITYTTAPVVYTPKPTIKAVATLRPTVVPTPTKTPIPTETPTPTASSEVKGASVTPIPTSAPPTTGNVIGVLASLAIIIGLLIWIIVKIVKKFKKPRTEI